MKEITVKDVVVELQKRFLEEFSVYLYSMPNEEKDFGSHIPVVGEQYAILLESDVPVVAQYGRAETREVAFYTTPGYCE